MTATFSIPTLETERLILRAPAEKDFEAEAAFYESDASRFVGGPMRPDQTWRALSCVIGHWALRGYGFWSVETRAEAALAGWCGIVYPDRYEEPELGWVLTTPFNMLSRCPVVSVPSGRGANGVPTGVQLVAPAYRDEIAMQAAMAYETAVGGWFGEAAARPAL